MAVHALADSLKISHYLVRVTFLVFCIPTNPSLQECEALVQTSLNEGQPLGSLVLLNQRSDLDLSALADHTHVFLEAELVIFLVALFVTMAVFVAVILAVIVAVLLAVIVAVPLVPLQFSLVVMTMTMAVAVAVTVTMVSMPMLLFGASARSLLLLHLHTKFNTACWLRDRGHWAKKKIIDGHECFW